MNGDVDITDIRQLVWAFATRFPVGPEGSIVFGREATQPLVGYLSGQEKSSMTTAKVVYNALDPEHLHGKLPKRSLFSGAYPPALEEKVLTDWTAYGYADAAA